MLALPRIRRIVGDRTIDTVSGSQAVLIHNGLNYRPRPIITSYAAYTPRLLELNADCYRGQHAPQFVLMNLMPIDGRYPASEDSGILLELLRSYRPVLNEKGFLLLERREVANAAPEPLNARESTFFFGEEVSLPDEPGLLQTVSFRFRLRGGGKLLSLVFRNPILYLNARLNTGERRRYRLVPGLAAHEFLLNPVIVASGDFVNLYKDTNKTRIVSFTITQEDFFGLHPYSPVVGLTLRSYPRTLVHPLSRSERDQVEANMGATPSRIEALGSSYITCDRVEALMVIAGTAYYDVPAGRRRVTGRHGMWAACYDPALNSAAPNTTDGMEFAIEFVGLDGTRHPLFRKRLDPINNPADRGAIPFAVELPPGQDGGILELRTFDKPPHSPNYDWGYWAEIKIE
jgi:hypothetical protein